MSIEWAEDNTAITADHDDGNYTRYFKGDTTVTLDGDYTFDELREIIAKCEEFL